jgi:UrcA family protein
MIKKTILAACTATVLVAAPAMARSSADGLAQTTVSYADLNLSSAAGRATLHSRIKGAVRFVCGSRGPTLAELENNRECQDNAIASANTQLEQVLARRGTVTVLAAR